MGRPVRHGGDGEVGHEGDGCEGLASERTHNCANYACVLR